MNMNPDTQPSATSGETRTMQPMKDHAMCDCGMGKMGMVGMGLLLAAVIAVLIAATIYLIRRSRALTSTPP